MRNERDERLVGLFGPMAAAVTETAPQGWSKAVLRAYATPFKGGANVVYHSPGGRERHRVQNLADELGALVELAKGPGAGLDVELTVEPSGRYEAVVTPRSKHGVSYQTCILRDDQVSREAGESQDGPVDDSQAGDPEEAVRLLGEYRRRRAQILGGNVPDPEFASAQELQELEEQVGSPLPADLRALYERAGRDPNGFYWEWLSVSELLDEYLDVLRWQNGSRNGDDPVLDADPPNTVRRLTGHPDWIPFAHDGSGNYLAVDLAPAPAGRPGQVIAAGNDYGDGPGYVADSVTSLLRLQLQWLEAGQYDAQEGQGWHEGYLEFKTDLWHQEDQSARERTLKEVDGPLPAMPKVQHLTVHGGGRLDLAPLRGAPLLKHLSLQCEHADLDPLADLPVEKLALSATALDLTPLAGHRSLHSLSVATQQPVEISCLPTLPRLRSLDLAEAVVTDLEALADLPELRVLRLSYEQWQELWRRSDRHPPLVYASVSGALSSAAISEWANQLPSVAAEPLLRHSGTLPAA